MEKASVFFVLHVVYLYVCIRVEFTFARSQIEQNTVCWNYNSCAGDVIKEQHDADGSIQVMNVKRDEIACSEIVICHSFVIMHQGEQ
jgi:hypothetical protein